MKKISLFLLLFLPVFIFSSCSKTAENFSFNQENHTIYVGDSVDIIYTLTPNDIDSSEIHWDTSNVNIATVSNGKITAISKGTCEITGTIDSFTCKCTVIVIEETNFEELLPEDMLKLPLKKITQLLCLT